MPQFGSLHVAWLTHPGQVREQNEDHCMLPNVDEALLQSRGYLFAIADGMGGYGGGQDASRVSLETLYETFYGPDAPSLASAVQSANMAVRRLSMQAGRDPRMGTTLAAVLLYNHSAVVAHVGDSRVYLIRQGVIEQITRDHSLLQEQLQAGLIAPEQVASFRKKNVITRSMGQHSVVQADFTTIAEIQPDDILLLCSDGLTNLVSDEEIAHMAIHTVPEQAVQALVNLANERGGPDNITVEIIRFRGASASSLPAPDPNQAGPSSSGRKAGNRGLWLVILGILVVVGVGIGVTVLFFW